MSVKFDLENPEAYHWRMNTEARIQKLEANEADIATIKANYATKDDIAELKVMFAHLENRFSETRAELRADIRTHHAETNAQIAETRAQIAEAKASIIQWSVTAIFIAQLLPALLKLFLPG
ncbi:hypothetical protein [Duganella sp.]|uniref:hypothetical protein n=1 Tax=Duganella sp. TaxID=1904440 RepID=UPI0031D6837A